ncbi:MAG: methionine gamma-lyase family protein [Clostridia bacterium]|nr:methionine gamma-lyase family protein [Clostridia bacterium]
MKVDEVIKSAEKKLKPLFEKVDETALFNQEKVLKAFSRERIAMRHFMQSNGYGYGDEGREALGKVFANAFGAEKAIVSPALLSGTHTITVALFGVLRPNDKALIITGTPYDTIRKVLWGEGNGSFKDFGISFDVVELKDGKVDFPAVKKALESHEYKMVYIQRSRGYELRDSFTVGEIEKMCSFVRSCKFEGCIFCDNCYGEFCETREPTEVGCDFMAGSLIKNPGGGLAPTGGYIAGRAPVLELVEGRLTAPSVGAEVGSYAYGYRLFYQGLFLAPHTVAQILKGGLLIGACLESLGYETYPKANKIPEDITRAVRFDTEKQLTDFIVSVQECSPVDSFVRPEAWDMPGYDNKVIMAAGTFVAGATSELSADAPIREPYVAYFQGGLTYEHCKIACKQILSKLI